MVALAQLVELLERQAAPLGLLAVQIAGVDVRQPQPLASSRATVVFPLPGTPEIVISMAAY